MGQETCKYQIPCEIIGDGESFTRGNVKDECRPPKSESKRSLPFSMVPLSTLRVQFQAHPSSAEERWLKARAEWEQSVIAHLESTEKEKEGREQKPDCDDSTEERLRALELIRMEESEHEALEPELETKYSLQSPGEAIGQEAKAQETSRGFKPQELSLQDGGNEVHTLTVEETTHYESCPSPELRSNCNCNS